MKTSRFSFKEWIDESLTQPIKILPQLIKEMWDELLALSPIYKWVTLLLVVYFAVPPLMYNEDPVQFHLIKLNTMYIVGTLLLLTVLFGYRNFPNMRGLWEFYKKERLAVLIMMGFMLFSLAINYPQMNLFVRAEVVTTSVFYGAGPNFISIFYYWLGFVLLFSIPVVLDHVPLRILATFIMLSGFLTAIVISYQIFVFDFIGVARSYLFGFGNSNYTPDAFAILGLYLLIPIIYKEKVSVWLSALGIFFFVIVLLSYSRASWVGLGLSILATLIYLFITKKVIWKRILVISLLGVAVLGSITLFLFAIGEQQILNDIVSLFGVFTDDADLQAISSFRTPLWRSAIEMWLYGKVDGTEVFGLNFSTIVFGNGQSVYLWVEQGTQYLVTNVHQMYLDVLMSAGFIVFGLFMWLLARLVKYSIILVKDNISYLPLFSALIYTMGKWLFNSLNGLHAPFVFTTIILIYYFYYTNHYNDIKKI